MAKNSLNDWSVIVSDNADIAGTNIAVGCPPQDVGVFMRTSMAQIAYAVQGTGGPIPETWHVGTLSAVNATVSGTLTVSGTVSYSGGLASNSGIHITAGGATIADGITASSGGIATSNGDMQVRKTGANANLTIWSSGGAGRPWILYSNTSGAFGIYDSAVAAVRFYIDGAGNGAFTQGLNVAGSLGVSGDLRVSGAVFGAAASFSGNVGANSITATGDVGASGAITGSALNTAGNLYVGGRMTATYSTVSGLTVLGVSAFHGEVQILGATGSSASGWQLAPGGTSSFSAGTSLALYTPADIQAGRFIAASDARIKTDRRPITADEGLRWVIEVPAYEYLKEGAWEAGFLAQDMHAAGFDKTLMQEEWPGMPAVQNGASGPVGKRWLVVEKAPVAYLAAAVRALLARVEKLEAQISAGAK